MQKRLDRRETVATSALKADVYIPAVTPFMVFAIIVFGLRMYARYARYRIGGIGEDIALVIVLLLATLGTCLTIVATSDTLAASDSSERYANLSSMLIFASEPPWVVATIMIRLVLTLTLLRFKQTRAWKIGLWGFFICFAAIMGGQSIRSWFRCTPVRAAYIYGIPGAKCMSNQVMLRFVYVGVALGFLSTTLYVVVPMTLIYSLNRPIRERLFGIITMTIGLLAIVASILKTYYIWDFYTHLDPTAHSFDWVKFLIAGWIELWVVIIGASAPSLSAMLIAWWKKVRGRDACEDESAQKSPWTSMEGSKSNSITVDGESIREMHQRPEAEKRAEIESIVPR